MMMMISRVNLVAILLTLGCVSRALENSRSVEKEERRGYFVGKRVTKDLQSKIGIHNALVLRGEEKTKANGMQTQKSLALKKNGLEARDHPRKQKKKMDRTMLALLMAYKMKFLALVPTMVGGLFLLKATTLLAGFFFALFAAVLGLKVH